MRKRNTISPARKGLHAFGLTMQVVGGIGLFYCFFQFATSGLESVQGSRGQSSVLQWFFGFAACGIAVGVGGGLRMLAARGIAGSGLVLDPERAREDLEPWARTGGGLVRDALDETGLLNQPVLGQDAPRREPAGPSIKVRCRECQTLNDEDARYCDSCGAKL